MTMVSPWFTRTGQRWKMLMLCVLLAGMLLLVGFSLLSDGSAERQEYSILAGIVTGACALVWMAFAFHCPQCQSQVGWWYLRNMGATQWFTHFVSMGQCPVCGFSPEMPPHPADKPIGGPGSS